jgi:hypothetical protein
VHRIITKDKNIETHHLPYAQILNKALLPISINKQTICRQCGECIFVYKIGWWLPSSSNVHICKKKNRKTKETRPINIQYIVIQTTILPKTIERTAMFYNGYNYTIIQSVHLTIQIIVLSH